MERNLNAFQLMQKENSPCCWLSYNVANSLLFMEKMTFIVKGGKWISQQGACSGPLPKGRMTKRYTFSVFHNLKENNLLSPLTTRLLLLPRASKPEFVFISRCCFPQHFALLAIQTAIKVQPASEFVRQSTEKHTFSKPAFPKRCFSPVFLT